MVAKPNTYNLLDWLRGAAKLPSILTVGAGWTVTSDATLTWPADQQLRDDRS